LLFAACSDSAGPETTTNETSTTSTSVTDVSTTFVTSTTGTTSMSTTLATTTTSIEGTTTTRPPTPTSSPPAATATTARSIFHGSLSDVDAARLAHSYTPECPVGPSDVVMARVTYWGFDGATHTGEIVVARSQGSNVVEIFRRLFEARYPIASIIPIGDLPEGVEDDDPDYNNTSGLHCRFVGGTTTWSEHARGLAIDINPFLNPYKTSTVLWPANSGRYLDRTLGEPGMITGGDAVVDAFGDSGWLWGGYWSSIKDYQHFSVSGR
jgi:hypothetical protein